MEAKRPFSQLDWLSTPEPVREYIVYLERLIGQMQRHLDVLEKRTEKLEVRTKMNSQNRTDFYSELLLLLMLHEGGDGPAGKLARSIARQLESLWVFLEEKGVEPTNNRSERALRFGVLWRKRSHGTQSDKGPMGRTHLVIEANLSHERLACVSNSSGSY